MTKPRVTTTDRLANIIEVIELGRRSGLLTVERGADHTAEQGELYFWQGHAIYAVVNGLRGRDALQSLAVWGLCRFAFEPNAPRPTSNISAPAAAPQPARPVQGQVDGASSGFFPAAQPRPQYGPAGNQAGSQAGGQRGAIQGSPSSAPLSFNWSEPPSRPSNAPPYSAPSSGYSGGYPSQASAGSGSLSEAPGEPLSPLPSSQPSSQLSSQPSSPSSPSSFGAGWPVTGGHSSTPTGFPGSTPSQTWQTDPSRYAKPVTAQQVMRRPRRGPDVRDLIAVVNTYHLSRSHRTVLLLADGEHTVLDLARLSSKPVEEIAALLADMERHGLVYYR